MKYYKVNRERWGQMTIFEQMGNIYSEVGRSINAKKSDDPEGFKLALIRVLDLFDATVECLINQKSVRAKEVLRAKDQFLHTLYDDNVAQADIKSLEQYFWQFAVAARLNR